MLLKKAHILIAEDETIIAMDIKATLEKIGYKVLDIVPSGEKVLENVYKEKPDLILMDISLSGKMDGIQAAKIVNDKYNIPVVYLTALADDETLERARVTSPFGYILKPFDERILHTTIEIALYKHKVDSELKTRTKELELEKVKTDELLHNIFPSEIVKELKQKGSVNPSHYDSVTILFTDFHNFTKITSRLSPDKLLSELNEIFTKFDSIIKEIGIEKLKTIGDSYMVAGGLPNKTDDHPIKVVKAGLMMQDYINKRNEHYGLHWQMRVGIHTGPCVAGIVGINKYTYDIWGDTVNIASRLETNCEPGKVNISEETYKLIKEHFDCEYRGSIEAKGKGKIRMYFVNHPKENIVRQL
jgi:class 3 adenylate cyclase/CheY-like chemotaxis protein